MDKTFNTVALLILYSTSSDQRSQSLADNSAATWRMQRNTVGIS